jgi:hypothetical protein
MTWWDRMLTLPFTHIHRSSACQITFDARKNEYLINAKLIEASSGTGNTYYSYDSRYMQLKAQNTAITCSYFTAHISLLTYRTIHTSSSHPFPARGFLWLACMVLLEF